MVKILIFLIVVRYAVLVMLAGLGAQLVRVWSNAPKEKTHASFTDVWIAVKQNNRSTFFSSAHDIRRLLVDPLVKERYLKYPSGFRKHPSYFSESYLTRAQERSQLEIDELTQKWGSWTFVDSIRDKRPGNDFYEEFPNRDVPRDRFVVESWQSDRQYLSKWLPEALALVNRTLEAILSEYGRGKEHLSGQTFDERAKIFKLIKSGPPPTKDPPSIGGWMNPTSYEGLKRRLLHAIMTEDRFNIAMGGHSAAAGHGNNFQQSYTLQIARVLEPVFARLGVKMTARNFGMGGLGTLQNGMALSDIYGDDIDVLLWHSHMTERNPPPIGVFAIQGLLSHRAPLLWFEMEKQGILAKIHGTTGADIAVYGNFIMGLPPASSTPEEMEEVPYALQWLACTGPLNPICGEEKFNGKCWVDRTGFQWEGLDLSFKGKQGIMKGQANWHPGWRLHQKRGRGFAFVILTALKEVLETWKEASDYAIPDSDWHVTSYYESIQQKTRENSDAWVAWCTQSQLVEEFCKFKAHGRTENGGRNRPWASSLRSIMVGMPSPNLNPIPNPYDPPDKRLPWLDPPKNAVDVLAIVENGVPFAKNLARIHESAVDMSSPRFQAVTDMAILNPGIRPGKGWGPGGFPGSDNCDGEYDSFCDRARGDCMLYGHNDHRNGLIFDGYSGWGIFKLPGVQYGTIVIKLHSWCSEKAPGTDKWCSENNEAPCKSRALSIGNQKQLNSTNTTMVGAAGMSLAAPTGRKLGGKPAPPYCKEFKFEFAIDGKITTWDLDTWLSKRKQNDRVVETWTLLNQPDYSNGKPRDVELAVRMAGCGRDKAFELTHVYWI